MKTSALRATGFCAMLATTFLTAPAFAQSAPPPRFTQVDDNGVDLTSQQYFFSMTEGTIGSGEGALTLQRNWAGFAGWSDNWSGRFYKRTSGGTTLAIVELGSISDTFTISGSTYSSTKGNGATLVESFGTYLYTAPDGTKITFLQGDDQVYFYRFKGVGCLLADANTCAIPTSMVKPNGMTFTYNWDFVDKCESMVDFECVAPVAYFRFRGVTSSANYSFTVNYVTDSPGNFSSPQTNWMIKTGVVFTNLASTPSSLPTVSYAYPSSTVTDVTDTGGRTWRLTNGSGGHLSAVRRPGVSSDSTSVTYSSGLVTAVAKDGVTTSYSRSVSGTTGTLTVTNALSQATTIVSDLAIGRPTSVTDALSHATTFTYDSSGRLTRTTSPEGNYVNYTYDARGNVTETRHVAKSGSGLSDLVSTAGYDSSCTYIVKCNKPNSVTDARGNTTDYVYDSTHGGLTSVTLPAPTSGATRPQTRYSYGQVTAVTGQPVYMLTGVSACQTTSSCSAGSDEARTTNSYETGNLLLASATSGNGSGTLAATTAMTYDPTGNLLTVDGPLSGTADTTRYRYDSTRARIGTISADPDAGGSLKHRAERVTINSEGLVTKVERGTVNSQSDSDWASFAALEAVESSYDANARLATSKRTSGGTTYALTQISYDAVGRAECVAQRMNPSEFASLPSSACTLDTQGSYGPDRIVKTVYDAAGQVTQVKTAFAVSGEETNEVTSTFSSNGQLATVADGEGNKTTYEYDGHDRRVKTRYPDSTKGAGTSSTTDYEQLTLDSNGNVTSRRLRDGNSIGQTFDALNRMTAKDLPNAVTYEADITYGYDLLNRLVSTGDGNTYAGTFTYDALGRKLTDGSNYFGTKTSAYDLAGRRTRLTWRDGFYVDYDYLVTGDMTAIRENGATSGVGVLATLAYDDLGRRTSLTRGDGSVSSYTYDNVSRLSQLADNLVGSSYDFTLGFSFNPAGQITQTTRSNDNYAWGGHYNVNRSYTANGRNQYTASGSITPTYDTKGNLTSAGSSTYGYTSENKLASGPSLGISHDPMGRMLGLTSSGVVFDYDGNEVVLESDTSTGTVIRRRFVRGPGVDEPLVWYEGSGTSDRRFLHADERGTIVGVTDSSGSVLGVNTYDEHGIPASTNLGRFQYTGQAWLAEVSLYNYKNRIYSPTLGRFLQSDPIGYGDGMNFYAYVGADPLNRTDPNGTVAWYCPGGPGGLHVGAGCDGIPSGALGIYDEPADAGTIYVTGSRGGGLTFGGGTDHSTDLNIDARDLLRSLASWQDRNSNMLGTANGATTNCASVAANSEGGTYNCHSATGNSSSTPPPPPKRTAEEERQRRCHDDSRSHVTFPESLAAAAAAASKNVILAPVGEAIGWGMLYYEGIVWVDELAHGCLSD
jgi:RHS repeat-associated protein